MHIWKGPAKDLFLLSPDIERPTPLGELQERLEGPQVARWMQPIRLPRGWEGFGVELTNGERWIVGAAPLSAPPFNARLFLRVFTTEQLIWTKRLRRRLRSDRDATECEADPQIEEVQRRVEGEVVRAFRRFKAPNEWGAESAFFEFMSGAQFHLRAMRTGLDAADFEWELEPPAARLIALP